MATQLTVQQQRANEMTVLRQTIGKMESQIKMALPSHIPVEKFHRVAVTAISSNPDLLNVDRTSLFGALMKAAQDGLLPDGREGAIVPFKGKASWMPMVAGIMKKVRNSGEIADWNAHAVYENDEFDYLLGDDQRIYHKPTMGDPGQVIGAYSIVKLKDGTISRDFMPRWRIEKAREQGMAKNSLQWTAFYDEGAIKTVIKHHAKRLPQSTDIEAVFERDDMMSANASRSSAALLSSVGNDAATEPVKPASRLDALEHQIQAEPHDAETGEIIQEGPADEQRGEAHSDAVTLQSAMAEIDAC
ncbi:recombinase RecT, partial [Sphingobium sp. PNB]|uniref:recombinase RecT n=1 Tax=Sphingobium sp. PNB TaxID=863934 RepID=UPI001CA430FE